MNKFPSNSGKQILNVALADDDEDDRLFFQEAIEDISIRTKLSLLSDGQELMDYLNLPNIILPNLIFLDLCERAIIRHMYSIICATKS